MVLELLYGVEGGSPGFVPSLSWISSAAPNNYTNLERFMAIKKKTTKMKYFGVFIELALLTKFRKAARKNGDKVKVAAAKALSLYLDS